MAHRDRKARFSHRKLDHPFFVLSTAEL
jgi:hypothetical protein